LTDKEKLIKETDEKLKTAEASLLIEKEAKEKAEGEIAKQAEAALISERKQVLTSINYPEDLVAKKADYLAKASKEDFESFVEEVKVLFASATKNIQAKAELAGYKEIFASLNLTGKTSESNEGDDPNKQTEKVNILF
jgi:predicted metal-dependent hydrolase